VASRSGNTSRWSEVLPHVEAALRGGRPREAYSAVS
jgi:hypothetical protein